MPAKIFCLASPKGGSGKTIVTATLGAFLAGLGKKVLIIDTDAATNGLTLFYLSDVIVQNELAHGQNRIPLGIYEINCQMDLNGTLKFSTPEIVPLSNGVYLIPATYKFKDTELVSKQDFTKALKILIESTRHVYQYIFIDAQAGSDECARICMDKSISDEVIIVSEYDPISNEGIERLKGILKEDMNPTRTWILYNKILPEIAKSYEEFLKYTRYLPPIPWDADVVKSYVNLKLALDLENGNEHTLAIIRIVKSLLGDNISTELEEWMNKRAAVIRQPINQQYHDLELQLKDNIRQIDELYRKKEKTVILKSIQYAITISFLLIILVISFSFFFVSFSTIFQSQSFAFIFEIIILVIFVSLFYMISNRLKENPEFQFNKSRLVRQQSVLEEKLKKLESLKTADLETLVKSKKIG